MRIEPGWQLGEPSGRLAPVRGTCTACAADHLRSLVAAELHERPSVTSPDAAVELLEPWLAGKDRERCVVALLDTKHRLLDVVVSSVGTLDHTFMNPREIIRDALLGNAAAIVIGHNHPSGDPEPSPDDAAVTRRMADACTLIGISLLDHVVVGGDRWISMSRLGLV